MFTSVKKNGSVVINIDDKYSREIIKKVKSNILTYGFKRNADIFPIKYDYRFASMSLTISIFKQPYKIKAKITGKHNLYNLMASIATCLINNIPIENIILSIEKIESIPGRMEFIGNNNNKIFIDYAHTPDAYNNILSLINNLKSRKDKIITLFGCGGDRDRLKRSEMAAISEKYSNKVIVTSDNPRSENINNIMNDIESGFNYKKHLIIKDRELAIKEAIKELDENSVLLVLGKGRENYQILNGKKTYHNDVEIIEKVLNEIV